MADAVDSKSIGGNPVGVRIPPPAPFITRTYEFKHEAARINEEVRKSFVN